MVTLEPISPEAFERWRTVAIRGYAADKVRVGAWPAEGAEERSERDFATLLPDGLATPGHHFRSIVNDAGVAVGVLWFGPLREIGRGMCFIWDIEVDAKARGRGYGRAALLALEPVARSCAIREQCEAGRQRQSATGLRYHAVDVVVVGDVDFSVRALSERGEAHAAELLQSIHVS